MMSNDYETIDPHSDFHFGPVRLGRRRSEDSARRSYGCKDGMALAFDVFTPPKPNGAGVLLIQSGGWYSVWSDQGRRRPEGEGRGSSPEQPHRRRRCDLSTDRHPQVGE